MPVPLKHIQPGTRPFSDSEFRETLNAMIDAIVDLQKRPRAGAPPIIHERPFIPVRIDGYDSTSGYYNYDEVEWDDTSEEWGVKSGGISETDAGPARAIGGSLDDGHQTNLLGRVVYITPRHAMDGSGVVVWEFTPPACESFWAKITGSTAVPSTSNRWRYSWTEQERTTDGFSDLSGGRSGSTSSGYAINAVEVSNDGSGVEGHGVDVDGTDYPAGFEVQPVQGNPVHRMWVDYNASGTPFYTFSSENADDGTCEAEE